MSSQLAQLQEATIKQHCKTLRMPMMLRYPPRVTGGVVREQMVLDIDIAPTLLDLAQVPIPPHIQGKSVLPVIAHNESPWRTEWMTRRPSASGQRLPENIEVVVLAFVLVFATDKKADRREFAAVRRGTNGTGFQSRQHIISEPCFRRRRE